MDLDHAAHSDMTVCIQRSWTQSAGSKCLVRSWKRKCTHTFLSIVLGSLRIFSTCSALMSSSRQQTLSNARYVSSCLSSSTSMKSFSLACGFWIRTFRTSSGRQRKKRGGKAFILRHYAWTVTKLISYLFCTSQYAFLCYIPRTFTGKVLVKKKGWKAGIEPPDWEPFSWWGRDCCRVMVGLEPVLAEGSGGQTGLFWAMLWLWVYSLWLLWCTSGETSMDKVPLVTWLGTMLLGSTMET